MVALMRKFPPFVASGLFLLLAGCQTPMFSDGLFSSLNPQKTLTAQKASPGTDRSVSATKPRIGGRGWRNASTRAAETQAKTSATGINNVSRLREFLAKGNDSMQKGLFDDARIQYETVLSLEPHHATAHHMLGRISDMSKKFDDAERHYLEALSANREDGYLLSDLGYSYLQQGRLGEARQYLMQAITREPDLAIAKVNLAAAYAYTGDRNGALAWLRQVGNEQQAQETLAAITSKPAPWIFNRANGALAEAGPTIDRDGAVISSNGQTLDTWQDIQAEMGRLREQGAKQRQAEQILHDYEDGVRVRRAMAEDRAYDTRSRPLNNDANLNQQMQDIEQASGNDVRRTRNTGPIYVGPPAQDNGTMQGSGRGQYQAQNYSNAPRQPGQNPQGQLQQYQGGGQELGGGPQGQNAPQQNPYSQLLNPAGPLAAPPQQAAYQNQQPPQYQSDMQRSSSQQQFEGSPLTQFQPPNGSPGPQQFTPRQQPQQQYQNQNQNQNLNSGQPNGLLPNGQPAQRNRQYGDNVYPGTNPAFEWSRDQYTGGAQSAPRYIAPQQLPPDVVPRDQYGTPIQSLSPTNPAWNGQPGNAQPQGSSAPNPNFFGQSSGLLNSGPQTGVYASSPTPAYSQSPTGPTGQPEQYQNGNAYYGSGQPAQTNQVQSANGWNNPQHQPIQQLGFSDQQPMARIDRGRRIQQYSESDRQAMQLGMAAGFGALAPINTGQSQSQQQGQQFGNGMPQNNVVPSGGPQQPANLEYRNSGFSYDRTSGQPTQQNQQLPDRGYPGTVPPDSGMLPGQANIQRQVQQIHGQSLADQMGLDPQTAQPWLRMPTSQADVTMPVAFSSSTQPTQQQSANWQRPEVASPASHN